MGQVPGAQHGGGRRLPERRGMDVAVVRRLRGRRGAHVLEHAVAADPHAQRAPGAHRGEPARGLPADPGVEAVGGEVQHAAGEARQYRGGQPDELA